MKLNNPHLNEKLAAMQEAAMINDEPLGSSPDSPNMNGKNVVVSLDEYTDATSV